MLNDPRISLAAAVDPALGDQALRAFDAIQPIVRIDSDNRFAANAAASTLAMLSRIFPHTRLEGDAELGHNVWGAQSVGQLEEMLAAVRPEPARVHERQVVMAIGEDLDSADMWLGGDDWTGVVGHGPTAVLSRRWGLGLQAAATLGVGELTKSALASIGVPVVLATGDLVWNLLDYSRRQATATADSVSASPMRIAVLGCGSVGTSASAMLAFERLSGICTAVDGDSFDPRRNPFRYPALLGTETGQKAPWVSDVLSRAGWASTGEARSVGEWAIDQPEPGFRGMVVSSVDERSGRMEVADLLAETTLSVGVRGLALHLQRERLGDAYACPFCEFVDVAPPSTQAGALASLTGLSIERVLSLQEGGALSPDDVAAGLAAGRVRPERAPELVGRRLADLVREGYAEATVTAPEGSIRIAAPHVSWLAGLLPVAEVVKAACGLPQIERRVDIDLTGLPTGFTRSVPRDHSGRCLCSSAGRRRWAARLYG
jgi:hypothetical protein